ncbi:MAG TPA: bifunctional DNA-binding transcriptional regulator/O6-methylguanine-DNA methyltransferase Ada [Acidimicrobiales bacterium]|nr:bifunctional DNA-binding transcriptional regulator/O6-methylguanine-DNA methyltransferase Ada [Acidimicrobiales bacterium]
MQELDEVRWRAVELRDASMSGCFVYAVTSTKVFCRPNCGSRRALRRNVEFFATPVDAVEAGYRACRRCRPEEPRDSDPSVAAVVETCRRLERANETSLAEIAADLGYSERHLRRRFHDIIGVSASVYARSYKAERVRARLREGAPVTSAVFDAGYGSTRAFYEHSAPTLGMAPNRYRKGGMGEQITFTTAESPLGWVVVARTPRGVCSIRVGNDEDALVRELTKEFSKARIERDDKGLIDVVAVLAGALKGECDATELPLDIAGTAFQLRVWDALRAIPLGETRTYSQIAQQIGAPRAVRAVASACAANEAALAIPCHRVVRKDGSMGGYRWGVEVKEQILDAEQRASARRS